MKRLTRFHYEIYCYDCHDRGDSTVGESDGDKQEAVRQARQHCRETGHKELRGWQWDYFDIEVKE